MSKVDDSNSIANKTQQGMEFGTPKSEIKHDISMKQRKKKGTDEKEPNKYEGLIEKKEKDTKDMQKLLTEKTTIIGALEKSIDQNSELIAKQAQQLEELKTSKTKTEQELSNLKNILQKSKKVEGVIEKKDQNIKDMHKLLSEKTTTIIALEKSKVQNAELIARKTQQLKELETSNTKTEQELSNLKNISQLLETEQLKKTQDIVKLESCLENEKGILKESKIEADSLNKKISEFKNEIYNRKKELSLLGSRLTELICQVKAKEIKLQQCLDESRKLNEEKRKFESSLGHSNEQIDNLKMKEEQRIKKNDELEKNNLCLKKFIDEKDKEIKAVEISKAKQTGEISFITKQNRELNDFNHKLRGEASEVKKLQSRMQKKDQAENTTFWILVASSSIILNIAMLIGGYQAFNGILNYIYMVV